MSIQWPDEQEMVEDYAFIRELMSKGEWDIGPHDGPDDLSTPCPADLILDSPSDNFSDGPGRPGDDDAGRTVDAEIDRLVRLERHIARLQAESFEVMAWLERRDTSGKAIVVEEIACAVRRSGPTVQQELKVARTLADDLPATAAALAAGEISARQATQIASTSWTLPQDLLPELDAGCCPARRIRPHSSWPGPYVGKCCAWTPKVDAAATTRPSPTATSATAPVSTG